MTTTPPTAADILKSYGFDPTLVQAIQATGGANAAQNLVNAIAKSALLQDMVNAFSSTVGKPMGHVVLITGNAVYSRYNNETNVATIYVGEDELKTWLANKSGTSAQVAGAVNLADRLAHEFGHMTLPSGHPGTQILLNPDQAVDQGLHNEGAAVAAQYVVTKQLGLSQIVADAQGQMTNLLDTYSKSVPVDPKSVKTLADLQDPSWFPGWQSVGGAFYSTVKPSTQKFLDYKGTWIDQWLVGTPNIDLFSVQVDWSKVGEAEIKVSGDSIQGWQFTGTNIPLVDPASIDPASVPNGFNVNTFKGETLSFTGSETPDNVITLIETWTLNGESTVVSGAVGGTLNGVTLITNETLTGGAGRNSYDLNFFNMPLSGGSATIQINCNGNGNGGLFTYANKFQSAAPADYGTIVAVSLNKWKSDGDSSETFEFKPGAGGSASGDLIITNFGGQEGAVVDLHGFNLTQAEAAGGNFLGIHLPQTTTLNFTSNPSAAVVAANGGNSEWLTLSVDAASATTQNFVVTLAGAGGGDFEVKIGDNTEVVNGDTFNVALAAGQTSVAFQLIDIITNDGSSDLADGGTVTVSAAGPTGAGSQSGVALSSVAIDYQPQDPVTADAPQPTSEIFGQYNSATSITTYQGDGGDDAIAGTGDKNLIDASDSGNDVITGGTGVNTITGSSGNNVITLQGSHDLVFLGGGFSTLNGGAGKESIYGGGGTAIIMAHGGTDLIFGGNGTNEIFAGDQVTLQQAIAQTQAAGATSGQGDLIGVLDGDNTVVGGTGNDYIAAGSGHDVIVMGSGNDTFVGGFNLTSGDADWTATVSHPDGPNSFDVELENAGGTSEQFTNGFPQPYDGGINADTGGPFGPANDTIYTGNGNDLVMLGNGNNAVVLGSGLDTVFGGMGSDSITAGAGTDFIVGGGGNTFIEGGSGVSTLIGGDGNNTIIAGSGNTTIFSATGPDGSSDYNNDSLSNNSVIGGAGKDLIVGSAGNDTLVAGSGATTIFGGSGNENILGGSGADLLQAGSGNATIMAGSGSDTIFGGTGTSSTYLLYGGDNTTVITGGSGQNIIYAGDGGTADAATQALTTQTDNSASTTIYGGSGVALLQGGVGTNVIYGGDDEDNDAPTTILAFTGDTTVYGGQGDEYIGGGSGTNLLYAGNGGESAEAPDTVFAGTGVATLYGGLGFDLLQDTESGQDLLVGGSGQDSLIGIGDDTLVAGTGTNVMQANEGSVTFQFNAGFGDSTVLASGGGENVVFGPGLNADEFQATLAIDQFGTTYLELDNDFNSILIQGGLTGGLSSVQFTDTDGLGQMRALTAETAGNDSLRAFIASAFGGDDFITVGSDNFFVSVDDGDAIAATQNQDTISSWGNNSTLRGSASVGSESTFIFSAGDASKIFGGWGTDSIVATGSGDTIAGGSGGTQVTLSGSGAIFTGTSGQDTISVSGANDTLVAGTGDSEFIVDDASTVIQAGAGVGVDTIVSSVSYTAPTNINVLTLSGSADLMATGNAGNDVLTGNAGNDTLVAGSGAATLTGGTGNTTFVVNNTSDVVIDNSSTAHNQIDSSVSYTLPTDVNTLVLTGTANLIAKANSGDDTLVSNSGADTLMGGSGHDTFIVTNPGDVIVLGTGTANIIYESSSGYTLPSGALTLTLAGTGNLVGTADGGNDTLVSNSGVDTLFGGAGNDTFIINNSADVVIDTFTTTNNAIQASVSYSLPTNVNTLVLTGTGALIGTGNSATDVITANSGNDTLIAGTGLATLVAGSGNNVFVVNNAGDVVRGAPAGVADTIVSSVSYSLAANVDSLVLTGTANLVGTANSDNDTLVSNSGVDTLIGGSGNETYVINNSNDVVQDHSTTHGSVVESSVSYTLASSSISTVLTGTANLVGTGIGFFDSLVGGAGQDTLVAASSFDTLVAGSGQTTLEGEGQSEVFVVNSASDVVTVVGGSAATDTIDSSVSFTVAGGVGTLVLTGSADLTGTAVSGNHSIVGNAGHDVLYAGSGADTLVAGSAASTLVGGTGADTFVVNSTADVLQNISAAANNHLVSSISYTLPTNINILTLTGNAPLIGVGNSASDTLNANDGNDTLIAGVGVADLIAGEGADLFIINNTADVVSNPDYLTSGGVDTIQSSVGYTLPNTINVLVLTGTASLVAAGNSQADSIVGNAGADTLQAGIGNDTLVAGAGLATLIGSRGNDTFVINNTGDVILDSVIGGNNTLVSSVSYTLPTNVNSFVLTGSAALRAVGNAGNDSIKGNAGADTLVAGSGNDTLVAGSGLATLIGGAGNDTFIVNSTGDVIQNAAASSNNAVVSSSSYVLPTNVNELTLTGVGNLTATGNAGNDTLIGGAGIDTLIAGTGLATLVGGSGNTTFVVDNQGDVVTDSFANANNTIQTSVSYTLPTNVNTLILTGTGNLSGMANNGRDTLISNSGVDTLIGGTGIDSFVVNNSADVVLVGPTANTDTVFSSISYLLPTNLDLLVLTGTQNLVGTAAAANDTLVANSGIDTLIGGAGDTFVLGNANDVVVDIAASTTSLIESSFSYTLPTNVNALTLTGTAALVATGNGSSDVIRGNAGADTLVAGAGPATLIGSSGHDVFVVNSSADVVIESGANATSTIESSVGYSLPSNVDTLILTGTANLVAVANSDNDTLISNSGVDTLYAGSGADVIFINNPLDVVVNLPPGAPVYSASNYTLVGSGSLTLAGTADLIGTGGAGNDTITAGAGNDTLVAGSGLATLIGGSGDDTFVVNDGSDVVEDSDTTTANTIVSSVSYNLPTNVDTLILTGTAALRGIGNTDLQNVLEANSGNDFLSANAENNTLYGGAGSDTLAAGWASNLIYAGSGGTAAAPTYVYGNWAGTSLLTDSTLYGGAGTDQLYGGAGSDEMFSGTGTSTLWGGDGSETLDGSLGTNRIIGQAGSNLIYGGLGTTEIDSGYGTNVIYAGPGGTAAKPLIIQPWQADASSASTIFGGSGHFAIYGGQGTELMYGGTGTGTLFGGTGADSIYGGSGAQALIDDNNTGQDLFVGGSGDQVLQGMGADTLVAGTGNETLSGGRNGVLEFNPGFGHATVGFIGGNNPVGNVVFGSGIQPGDLTLGVQEIGSDPWLTISDGTSTLDIQEGFEQNVISSISFADTGPMTIAQLMEMDDAAGTVVFDDLGEVVSTGDGQSIVTDPNISGVAAFGNADNIVMQRSGGIFASGNNDTINVLVGAGADVVAVGNNDLIYDTDAEETLSGSHTTLVGGQNFISIYDSTDVIVAPPDSNGFVDAYVSYSLPANIGTFKLHGDSLVGITSDGNTYNETDGDFNTLIGGAGRDTLIADGHNDVLVAGSGPGLFVLTSASDTFQMGAAPNSASTIESYYSYTLATGINNLQLDGASLLGVANSGDDVITGSGDTLVAGSGNDTLVSKGGSDTMLGGSGNDTFIPADSTDVIIETWTTTSNTLVASRSYSLPTNVNTLDVRGEGIVGTGNSANDLLVDISDYGDNTLVAGSGNDTLTVDFQPYGSAGDTLVAGSGHDLFTDLDAGRQQTFRFNQGFSQDTIVPGGYQDVIAFGPGISASGMTFTAIAAIGGAAPSFVMSGYGGAVTVQGGLAPGAIGAIQFSGGGSFTVQQLLDPSGRVTVAGAAGNLIMSSSNGDSITAGSGNDSVIAWGNGDTITAGTGGTLVYAEGSADQVYGGSGADTLAGFGVGDTLNGGSGSETYVVADASTVVNAANGGGQDTVVASVSYTVPNNVSVMIMTGTASLTATGNSSNEIIIGNAAGDTFVGGAGVDTFVGNASYDPFEGAMEDYFEVNNSADVVEVSGSGGFEVVASSVDYTLPANVNQLLLNGSFIVGTASDQNVILGTTGQSANDTLISGSGVDTFGNTDGAVLVVNNSADFFLSVNSFDTIESGVSATVGGGFYPTPEPYFNYAQWLLTGTANLVADDQGYGNLQITGNAGNDTLIGSDAGYDILVAGTGVDTLIGGGNGAVTTFVINNAADVIITQASAAGNNIRSYISYTLPTNISQLTLEATGLLAQGNSVNGGILTAYGQDTLMAGSGNETLQSATFSGPDTLIAGSGHDVINIFGGDVAVLQPGFGQSEVSLQSGTGSALVDFGAGISPASLTASVLVDEVGDPSLVISYGATAAATLDGALANQTYQFEFGGGSPLTLAQFLSEVNVSTSSVNGGGAGNLILEGLPNQSIAGGTDNDTIYAAGAGDTLFGGSGNQLLVAVSANVSVVGGSGSDTLEGLGTNDSLVAGSAIDTLIGGTGATVEFFVNNSSDRIQLQSSPGADTVSSSVTFSLPANVTTLILTAAGIKGSANSSGADTLIASTVGIDTLAGGSGNDTFILNVPGDVVTDTSASAHNTVQAGFSYTLPTDVNTLILTGTAALTGNGNTAADLIVANSGADTLTAAGTNATTLQGGGGSDTFVVVNSKDVVIETFTGTNDLILSSASYTLPTNVNVLTLTGTAALAATGNGQNDVLNANSGADTLFAGVGTATLNGGTGNDIFVVNNTADVVHVTATGVTDTIESTVSYVLPANVLKLTLEGTAALSATGNNLNDTLTANSGADTLIAGSAIDSLVGGAGSDLFIINSTADVVSVGATHGNDTIQSSVNVTAPANVANITLTGTANLSASGSTTLAGVITANSGADTLTALDTVAGSVVTLVGGAGNDTFAINSSLDVIIDTYTTTTNTLNTSVTYTLPTNVNILDVTGTVAVVEHGNSGNDSMTANNAADTLVAGNGTDTLVSGTGIDSLVGGTGTDLFVVKNASDIVTVATTGTNDTISSSVSYTLPTNVQYLVLTGTAAINGTGNSLTDLIVANTGTDTLIGGTGIAVLEGGSGTLAHDTLKAPSAQAALIAGGGASTLNGGAFKDFYAAGAVSDSITTGASANVIAVNKGDGATTFVPTTGASDVLSLGAGIDTESLTFTKSGTANLILSDGVTGDSITFTNWFTSANNQDIKTLQVVEQASASYNASGTDALHNKPLEEFNFTALVTAFTNAGSPAGWLLSTGMPAAALTSSATSAYGGDLAYYFGLNGNLTGMTLSAAQAALTNASFATAPQTINSWASISGGGGLHLLAEHSIAFVDPVQMQWLSAYTDVADPGLMAGGGSELDMPHEATTTLVAGTAAARSVHHMTGNPHIRPL